MSKAKHLLLTMALVEAATGLALTISPAVLVSLLLGSSLNTPAGLAILRLTGAALCSLGLACWKARDDVQSRAATGLMMAVLLYNSAAAAILVHARVSLQLLGGLGLWPAVLLHAALAIWCIDLLRTKTK